MEFGVKKIVFSSSATVYGDPEYLPVDEKHPTGKCTNPYGKTKFFMEEIIKDVCAANPVSVTYILAIRNTSRLTKTFNREMYKSVWKKQIFHGKHYQRCLGSKSRKCLLKLHGAAGKGTNSKVR